MGFAVFTEQGPPHSYYLKLIVVDPAHQKQGVGTKLIFAMNGINQEIKQLRFDARKLNKRAIAWYQRLGFQDDSSAIEAGESPDEFVEFKMEF